MNLRTLLDIKHDLELCISIYGATAEVGRDYKRFVEVLQARYAPLKQDKKVPPSVLNADVSAAVVEAFRPVYDVFKPYAKEFIGRELPQL